MTSRVHFVSPDADPLLHDDGSVRAGRFVAACGYGAHVRDATSRPEYVECAHCRRAIGIAPAVRAEDSRGLALIGELIAALGGE
jgi:hypothetical protein